MRLAHQPDFLPWDDEASLLGQSGKKLSDMQPQAQKVGNKNCSEKEHNDVMVTKHHLAPVAKTFYI